MENATPPPNRIDLSGGDGGGGVVKSSNAMESLSIQYYTYNIKIS